MKIHFSNVNFTSQTGPNTFGYRLAQELAKKGHEIVSANIEYDIMLAFIEPTTMPRPKSKFFLRLDGIWFKPEEFHTHNRGIKWSYQNARKVIWQSEFDRSMTTHHWGTVPGQIIHNGIDLKKYEKYRMTEGKTYVCSANWHRQKRLKENIELFNKISKEKDLLFILGEVDHLTKFELRTLISQRNIRLLGKLSHEECLQLYANADWMIHLAWLDHCPNVVVEALSQGCPVICTDMGGTKELVERGGGIVIPEKYKYNFELADYDNPPKLDYPEIDIDTKPVVNFEFLDIKSVANQYEEVLSS